MNTPPIKNRATSTPPQSNTDNRHNPKAPTGLMTTIARAATAAMTINRETTPQVITDNRHNPKAPTLGLMTTIIQYVEKTFTLQTDYTVEDNLRVFGRP